MRALLRLSLPLLLVPAAPAAGQLPTIDLDAASAYLPDVFQSVWVVEATSVTIPVITSAPVPGPATATWSAWGDVVSNGSTLSLPTGATGTSYGVTFGAGPPASTYPGWEMWPVTTYVVAQSGVTTGANNLMNLVRVAETGAARGPGCLVAWLCWITQACQLGRGPDLYTTLQRYRDEVLAATADGQYYANLYTQYSDELARAAVKQPDLAARTMRTLGDWSGPLLALVDGLGSTVTVTPAMRDSMQAVLDALEQTGSAQLVQAIAFERQRLSLDTIAGLTLDEFQQQVETLGGTTAVTERSWGRVKSLYR